MRGEEIAMIFQDPMASLNPVIKIGKQIAEQILAHEKRAEGARRASGRSSCCSASGSRAPRSAWTPTRTSSPAACASAS